MAIETVWRREVVVVVRCDICHGLAAVRLSSGYFCMDCAIARYRDAETDADEEEAYAEVLHSAWEVFGAPRRE